MTVKDLIKGVAPRQAREQVRGMLVKYGERTSDQRPLPDFLIIGTKRGGTTSLWRYLIQHPLVPRLFPAWNTKTSHYFEENFHRGEAWYRSHFPTARQRAALERRHGAPPKAGEAAPLYMFHPLGSSRVATVMPGVRLVVLLRDPVERAYSHWKERRTEGVPHRVNPIGRFVVFESVFLLCASAKCCKPSVQLSLANGNLTFQ